MEQQENSQNVQGGREGAFVTMHFLDGLTCMAKNFRVGFPKGGFGRNRLGANGLSMIG